MLRSALMARWTEPIIVGDPYFSFTNSKTKIAQTPTVMGNCAACASRNEPPRGSKNERQNIATAVSIPRISLLFQGMVVSPRLVGSPSPPANLSRAVADILRRNPALGERDLDRAVRLGSPQSAGSLSFAHPTKHCCPTWRCYPTLRYCPTWPRS